MTSKLNIKIGPVELYFDGDEDFLRNEVLSLVQSLTETLANVSTTLPLAEKAPPRADPGTVQVAGRSLQATTATIAGRIGAKNGPDLIVAAAAHLTLVKGLEKFERRQLLAECKSASGYYKETYGKNLTNSLNSLVKRKELTEQAQGIYALPASKRQELVSRLAD